MKKTITFILFHTGETKALMPSIKIMLNHPAQYELRIIPVGQSAKNLLLADNDLKEITHIPAFVKAGRGSNEEYQKEFSPNDVEEVVQLCVAYNNIVIGFPAIIQEQIARALPAEKNRIIYFDSGSDQTRIRAFSPFANTLIFTSLLDQHEAQHFIDQLDLNNKPTIVAAKHGDFNAWLAAYRQMTPEEIDNIRKTLHVDSKDKIILWAGGYGNPISDTDKEAVAFKAFLDTFTLYKEHYQLRITLHPGLKNSYSKEKLKDIQENYYLTPLRKIGYSDNEIQHVITPISSIQAASVALGVFSAGSTVARQTVMIGGRAKNITPFNDPGQNSLFEGIEDVKKPQRLSALLARWLGKKRRLLNSESYKKTIKKLKLPVASTANMLKKLLISKKEKTLASKNASYEKWIMIGAGGVLALAVVGFFSYSKYHEQVPDLAKTASTDFKPS